MVLVATQVKRRRGTTAENDAFTGAEGEIVVDTERHELRVHDGVTQGGFKIGGGSGALVIGQILEVVGTADYTPEGCLLADGAEYTKAQFPDLWADFLTGTPKLQTCTYTEYANQIAEYGFCDKFAVDTTNETFKVPTRNKYRKLVKKIVNSDSWANIYDDGWVEQGGHFDKGGLVLDTSNLINLIIPMSNINYTLVTQSNRNDDVNGSINNQCFIIYRTTTQFRARCYGDGTSQYIDWQVSGYAPIPDSTANITREFVVVANGTLNQEQMDWSAWASSLASRATTDMNNITSTGKETVVGWGMPDYSAGISLSGWQATNTNFTVPCAGYIQVFMATVGGALETFYIDDIPCCAIINSFTNYVGNAVGGRFIEGGVHTFRSATPSRTQSVIFYPCKGVL